MRWQDACGGVFGSNGLGAMDVLTFKFLNCFWSWLYGMLRLYCLCVGLDEVSARASTG